MPGTEMTCLKLAQKIVLALASEQKKTRTGNFTSTKSQAAPAMEISSPQQIQDSFQRFMFTHAHTLKFRVSF